MKERTKFYKIRKEKKEGIREEKWIKVENSKDMSDFWNALRHFRPRKQVNGQN